MRKIIAFLFMFTTLCFADSWTKKLFKQGTGKGDTIGTYWVSVNTTTAAALFAADSDMCDNVINNRSSNYLLYIGSSTVTTLTGFPIDTMSYFSIDGRYEGAIYAIYPEAAGTTTVYILKLLK